MRPAGAPPASAARCGAPSRNRHAFFAVAPDRHEDHAKSLLADTEAIVTSDRWWAYAHLPLARRQICWSHLRRDFQAHAEGLAAEKEFGEVGLELCERVFWAWEVFAHTRERSELKRTIRSLQRRYKPIIRSFAAKRARNTALPRHGAQPAEALAGAVDVRRSRGRAADQQPRRARTAQARSSTASSRSAASPRVANGGSSDCSRRRSPAACSAARCSPT